MMKVILKEDVEHLGKAGEVVKVAPGYARNFLLPKRKAMTASLGKVKDLENKKRHIKNKIDKMKLTAEDLAKEVAALSVTIRKTAGEQDKLFGSVTSMDIAGALAKEGITVDKKAVIIEEPIKSLGDFTVKVKIYKDVIANLRIWVVRED
jgi:large subunit ribosomal protein L9